MQQFTIFSRKLPDFIGDVGRNIKELILRVVVHGAALFSGLMLAGPASPDEGYLVSVLAVYTGFVCLFAREISMKAAWLFPFFFGIVQCAASFMLGEPLQVCLFWAGVQTWVQRFVWKQGNMGVEWGMILMIVPGVISVMDRHPAFFSTIIAFVAIGVAAWIFRTNFLRSPLLPSQVKKMRQDQADLRVVIDTGLMAKPLDASAKELASLLGGYTNGEQFLLPREAAALVREVGSTTTQLMSYVERSQPQAWDAEAQRLQSALLALCTAVRRTMPQAPGADVQSSAQSFANEAALAAYRSSIAELAAKKSNLPLDLQGYVDGICKDAENILESMRIDQRDVKPGGKFMDRYLPAVHKVVDEHTRLSREKGITRELADALARSKETLARLQGAFNKEHISLLQNDVDDFSVELGVLDKLLKMDGR